MPIYAISDLHLSLGGAKPMDIFGPAWENHAEKIARNWDAVISNADTVLIAGDTSWATRFEEALPDPQYLAERPGRKILIRGNHDYWWKREDTAKLRRLVPPTIELLQGNAVEVEGAWVMGTRGWAISSESDKTLTEQRLIPPLIQKKLSG